MYILLYEEQAKTKRMPSAILREHIFISPKAIEAQGEYEAVGEQVQCRPLRPNFCAQGSKTSSMPIDQDLDTQVARLEANFTTTPYLLYFS